MFSLPQCRYCGRTWKPAKGVSAERAFCAVCGAERRDIAARKMGLRAIAADDRVGKYVLPKAWRSSSAK
jgi:hypothetical protein